MITSNNITLAYGSRVLFKDASIKFTPGNCYGLIGANGAGKSTFMKILSGEIEADSGEVIIGPGQRIAVLKQDQFAFDQHTVIHTVIMGHKKLYDIMIEKDSIYEKPDFSEADGIRASELEGEFADLNGWEAESEAAMLLSGLGIDETFFEKKMAELEGGEKVRVLLAQALFGNPDILLLDEPTNHLDIESVNWLEDFLIKFPNTVIVISHDRHFLNTVCTHIADIDFQQIQMFVGNYDFWYQSSQLMRKQMKDQNKKNEDKIKELKEFIQRFSSNASKSRQATSRKKLIDKLTLDDMKSTSRKFPYIAFKPERESGKSILSIENLTLEVDGLTVLKDFSIDVQPNEKIAFVGPNNLVKTSLFKALMGELPVVSGSINWGVTIKPTYFPKENTPFFDCDYNLVEWLRRYAPNEEESNIRGFLGRMLFSGDEALKKVNVLSGGERVRCMLSKMMMECGNLLILDEPTNHLDLEAITSLNNGLIEFTECVLFNSHDHQFVDTVASRIIEITPSGVIDRKMPFDDYMRDKDIQVLRDKYYHGHEKNMI